jgi:hypothetical protein
VVWLPFDCHPSPSPPLIFPYSHFLSSAQFLSPPPTITTTHFPSIVLYVTFPQSQHPSRPPCSVTRFLVKFLLLLSLISCRISLPFTFLTSNTLLCLVSYCSSTPPPSRCFERYRYFPKRCIKFPFDFYSSSNKKARRDRSTPRQLQFTHYSSVPHCSSFFFFFFFLFTFSFILFFSAGLLLC